MEIPFELTEKLRQVHDSLSKGMMPGGYIELSKCYPEKIKEIDEELHNNMTAEGIKRYKQRLTEGLKRIGKWRCNKGGNNR